MAQEDRQEMATPPDGADESSARVLNDIRTERRRQDERWGVQNHDPLTYMTILTEEVGEAAKAAVELRFGDPAGGEDYRREYREELVQVAAVAVAMIECADRGLWRWTGSNGADMAKDGGRVP